jgi:DNA-binding response OmpR family regulator
VSAIEPGSSQAETAIGMYNPMSVPMILLVEDDPDHEALAIRALRKANVANEIDVAHDGAEAIEYMDAITRGEKAMPQLVLLDLKLPKVEGLEVLRKIRAVDKTALLPVVVLTSSDEERDIVSSYRLGVNSYIRKPVNFTDFAEATKQLGMYWLLLNQCPPAL